MMNASEQFATLAAIALAYENSQDETLLPDSQTLISIVRDPNSSFDSVHVSLHILSILQPQLSTTEVQQIKYAVLRLSKAVALNPARLAKIQGAEARLLGNATNN